MRILGIDSTSNNSATLTNGVYSIFSFSDMLRHSRNYREARLRMSRKALADRIGYSVSTIAKAEQSPNEVTLGYWFAFATKILGHETIIAPTFDSLEKRRNELRQTS